MDRYSEENRGKTRKIGFDIRERTIAGLEAARARGRLGGRSEIPATASKVAMAKKLYADKTSAVSDICKTLNTSRATLYRYVKIK